MYLRVQSRKVQKLGPSTLAVTLPVEWTREYNVGKGDELTIRESGRGPLIVVPEFTQGKEETVTIHVDEFDEDEVERAIIGQYVLGRRIIHVENGGALNSEVINAIYEAESQLMGVGVIEETPERITIRCSVDPGDFTLDNLLVRLENTGSTMRKEAIKALAHGNPDLAQRAINREKQANKIFVLILRLIFTAHQSPNIAQKIGLNDTFPLIGYRSVAKNLELTADNAEDIAEIVLEAEDNTLNIEQATMRRIREFNDQIDEITEAAVQAVVNRDYAETVHVRELFSTLRDREAKILADLPEMDNEELLRVREVLVCLQQTAEYAVRNAEVATNLVFTEESEKTSID